ncbi:MAG: hypothetical protein SA339_08335 [Methanomassiliicoccus sp.]|nr:hypothetical protein [Methanomassiliicoccus sp.]
MVSEVGMAYFKEREKEIARFDLPDRQREVRKIQEQHAEKHSGKDPPIPKERRL